MRRFIFLFLCIPALLQAQQKSVYTLEDLILIAQSSSPSALIVNNSYRAQYWNFKAYRAQLLPSLNLGAGLAEFNRSTQRMLDAGSEEYKYVSNSSLDNSLMLSIKQNIAPTGGTLSLYTRLDRLDQFSPTSETSYQSTPVSLTYLQPIGGYNSLKWQKKMEPKAYELAKKEYLEDMESVAITVVQLFFNVLLQQKSYEMAVKNYENTDLSYKMAEQRFALGAITKNDLLQLQVSLLNSRSAINDAKLAMDLARSQLRSYTGLGRSADFDLKIPVIRQGLSLDYAEVLDYSYLNGSLKLNQELKSLEADRAIAQAKADRGIQADLKVTFGLSQYDGTLDGAYKNPTEMEVTGISLSMPILDWGMGKGRVKMAQSRADVVAAQVEQAFQDHEQNVLINVMHFNNLVYQCEISRQADRIAQERYEVCLEKFANSTLSVTELNTAQAEKDNAAKRYIGDLRDYWRYYFEIRKLCLYDFILGENISTEFDKLVEE